eukprot:7010215-Pyramimonas_sp.AAC.2
MLTTVDANAAIAFDVVRGVASNPDLSKGASGASNASLHSIEVSNSGEVAETGIITRLNEPKGVTVMVGNDLIVTDNHSIHRINAEDGTFIHRDS